jgi:ABC-type transporter MlaC component
MGRNLKYHTQEERAAAQKEYQKNYNPTYYQANKDRLNQQQRVRKQTKRLERAHAVNVEMVNLIGPIANLEN